MSKIKIGNKELRLDGDNPVSHGRRNREMVKTSLQNNGAGRSIVIRPNEAGEDEIVVGNNVAMQAEELGTFEPLIVDAKANQLVMVRRRDLTPEQVAEMKIADNAAPRDNEWNPQVVARLGRDRLSLYFEPSTVNRFAPLGTAGPSYLNNGPALQPPPERSAPPSVSAGVELAAPPPIERHPLSVVWTNAEMRAWNELKGYMGIRGDKDTIKLLMKAWVRLGKELDLDDMALVDEVKDE